MLKLTPPTSPHYKVIGFIHDEMSEDMLEVVGLPGSNEIYVGWFLEDDPNGFYEIRWYGEGHDLIDEETTHDPHKALEIVQDIIDAVLNFYGLSSE